MSTSKKRLTLGKNERPVRRRRSAAEAKSETIAAARKILLSQGPDAVTLKNVAAELGTTHTNLLHHFGTAGDLQTALMTTMVQDLSDALAEAIKRVREDEDSQRGLIETVFDAFDKGGAGRLAAWIALSNKLAHLGQMQKVILDLVKAIEEITPKDSVENHQRVTSAVIFVALLSFGDAIIGAPLETMLGRERQAARKIAAQLLPQFF
ncbi:MAG TPA: TetR family transcriptional regulator [Rhizomicrobium sp.]|nr:TetR family transcriptional regulator [Rhizomicrobium sp.]